MSRFGRKLARLNRPGATRTAVVDPPTDAPAVAAPAVEAPPAQAELSVEAPPSLTRADAFSRAGFGRSFARGEGWDLDGIADDSDGIADDSDGIADDSDGIADDSDGIADDSDAIADDSDAIADDPSGVDAARLARIARLRARMDAMVGQRQQSLRGEAVAARRAGSRRDRPAPSGAWGRLARGSSPDVSEPTAPESTRDPDDFSAVPGALEETEHGPIHFVRETFGLDHCHGHTPVGPALSVSASEVARFALDPQLAGVDMRHALFVDTETTGLYGSGTVPFLIGLGWFEDDRFELCQLFLRRLGEERPMLDFLADRLARASCIVSYNGKSFDWPLLCQRFVMNRLPPPADPLHLDLLHCARRAYKKRLGGARLVQIEQQVLGMHRVDDTPGHEIPVIYLDFVRGGPAEPVAGIIEHNAHDIVAMAALLGRLAERFATAHRDDDPRDLLSYARIAERAGDEARATDFALVAADRSTGAHAADAWLLHARLARRRADWDTAESSLQAALAEAVADEQTGAAHLALAKLFEHRRKDFDRALRHAYHTRWMEGTEAWQKRLDRLERKRARLAGAPPQSRGT